MSEEVQQGHCHWGRNLHITWAICIYGVLISSEHNCIPEVACTVKRIRKVVKIKRFAAHSHDGQGYRDRNRCKSLNMPVVVDQEERDTVMKSIPPYIHIAHVMCRLRPRWPCRTSSANMSTLTHASVRLCQQHNSPFCDRPQCGLAAAQRSLTRKIYNFPNTLIRQDFLDVYNLQDGL